MIASTVNTIIGQRLVRRVAEERTPYQTNSAETEAIHQAVGRFLPEKQTDAAKIAEDLGFKNLPLRGQTAYTLWRGKETSQTPGGYKGRLGLYEVIDVNDDLESMILNRSTSGEIQEKASELGMVTMREDGYLKALTGLTTIDEVNRVTAADSA